MTPEGGYAATHESRRTGGRRAIAAAKSAGVHLEMSRRGGLKTVATYGREHMSRIGRVGYEAAGLRERRMVRGATDLLDVP